MRRTVQLLLRATPEQERFLQETARQFTEAFNAVCVNGWAANEKNGVRLHHLTYRALKNQMPDLVSDLHIQARVKAAEALKSAFARRRNGYKTSCPHSTACPPRYNLHTFKIDWTDSVARLSTTGGRLEVEFSLPGVFAWAATGRVCTADLIRRGDRFLLHVSIETTAPAVEPSSVVVGVDLGVNRPAVTSDAAFLGSRQWKNVEGGIFRRKRQCQAKAKRSKSAKRRLKILSGQQARFRRDCDHVLSRRIVDGVPPGGTVALENLTDIRKRMKGRRGKLSRRLHGWSFAQLRSFIAYKAEARGARVVAVDPRHTSQTCSKCNHQHRSNRMSQSLFRCRACGFTLNADLNAARNVRAKHLVSLGTPLADRPLSTGPTSPPA